MASLNELIGHLEQGIDQIEQAVGTAQACDDHAGELQSRYAGMDDVQRAAMMADIKAGVEAWRVSLQHNIDQGRQLVERVEAVSGSG